MEAESTGAISSLIREFTRLPGIGPKSAERIAHYILASGPKQALDLAEALRNVVENVHPCPECHNLTEHELCHLCSDPSRDNSVLCVVEQPRDVASLERVGTYKGLYHVLHGRIAPLDNVGPEQLTIDALVTRVRRGDVKEIIMATNPTLEGDGTALFVSNLLAGDDVRITRLARGIPSGSVLEFANSQMVADALDGRQVF